MPMHMDAYKCIEIRTQNRNVYGFLESEQTTKTCGYHNSATCYVGFYHFNVIQKSRIIYIIFHENILDHWRAHGVTLLN